MAPPKPFQYRARVKRVIDGDTLEVEVDLGFYNYHHTVLRLAGIDAPEPRGIDKLEGKDASEHLRSLVHGGVGEWPLLIETSKTGKYGRWIATLFYYDPNVSDFVNVNTKMVDDGFAELISSKQ